MNILRYSYSERSVIRQDPYLKPDEIRLPFHGLCELLQQVIINILVNVDHGAIPAGTTTLKKENNLDNVELGIIGSLVYLGLVLGSISAGPIFASYSSKWVVILTLLFSCFFLYCFTFIKGGRGMAFCRVGCGFCQVFCYIYFPVWDIYVIIF